MDKDTQIKDEQVNQESVNEFNIDYKDRYWKLQAETDTLKRVCKAQAELISKLLK